MFIFLIAAQTAAPDLQLDLRVQARDVRIERKGEARLEVTASPDGGSEVQSTSPPAGDRRRLRNVDIRVKGEARIAPPSTSSSEPPLGNPQP